MNIDKIQEKYTDFVGIYKNAFDIIDCDNIIDYFNELEEDKDPEVFNSDNLYGGACKRLDTAVALERVNQEWCDIINESVLECLQRYRKKYFSMEMIKHLKLISPFIKIQKTYPQGGYHVWHYEVDSVENISRSLAWILYLNDVPSGEGETEFLWQGLRISPEKGTLIIWPAQFTHTHRGNPVYNCTKYIATGWIEYADVHEGEGPWRVDDSGFCYHIDNPPNTCDYQEDEVIYKTNKSKLYKKLSDLI